MNFSSIDYFVVLARERSFTKAAEHLHITQQSLSAHIAGLEKELGCQLFVRHIPLELTYAGERYLKYATELQNSHITMLREFSDIANNQKGVLRIGAASSRGRVLLPPVIARFQKIYPHICIDLTEGSNDTLCHLLQQGSLDLAIADFPDTLPDIQIRDYYQEETFLYIRRDLFEQIYGAASAKCEQQFHEGNFTVLKECPIVIGSMEDIDGRIGYAVLKRAGVNNPLIQSVSHNVGMLITLCANGIGACFCPQNLAQSLLTKQQMTKMMKFRLDKDARYWIRFGWQSRAYQWSVIDKFMECCTDERVL